MRADVLVVGGGIIGASVLRRLAEAGFRTMLIEGLRPGLGATGYSGAMVRLAHPTAAEVAAASEGLAAYQAFPDESDGRVALRVSGHLYFGRATTLELILPEVAKHTPGAQILTRDEISVRWPALEVTAETAIYEPQAGYADPVAFVRHQLDMAVEAGAWVAEASSLLSLLPGDGHMQGAQTSLGRIEAKAIVLATGSQTPHLLVRHGLALAELWSQKIQVSCFDIGPEVDGWPGFTDNTHSLNGVPAVGRGHYHIGLPTGLRIAPDETDSREAAPAHAMATRSTAQTLIPGVANAHFSGAMCHTDCYGTASIGTIGPHRCLPDGLLLATGFSGGGFKMAPHAARRIYEFLA